MTFGRSSSIAGCEKFRSYLRCRIGNPHSPTYGCFDRNYWHYRIIDFPSGMAQEFVLPAGTRMGYK